MKPNRYGDGPQVYTFFEGQWQVEAADSGLAASLKQFLAMRGQAAKSPFGRAFTQMSDGVFIQDDVADKQSALRPFLFLIATGKILGSEHCFLCRNVVEVEAADRLIGRLVDIDLT